MILIQNFPVSVSPVSKLLVHSSTSFSNVAAREPFSIVSYLWSPFPKMMLEIVQTQWMKQSFCQGINNIILSSDIGIRPMGMRSLTWRQLPNVRSIWDQYEITYVRSTAQCEDSFSSQRPGPPCPRPGGRLNLISMKHTLISITMNQKRCRQKKIHLFEVLDKENTSKHESKCEEGGSHKWKNHIFLWAGSWVLVGQLTSYILEGRV